MKKPIVGYEYEDTLCRDQRIEALYGIKHGWGGEAKRPLTRRERYELRCLELHAAGGREGKADKWASDEVFTPIKKAIEIIMRIADANACYLTLETCRQCLLPRKERIPEKHKNHHCEYLYDHDVDHFAETLGAGPHRIRERSYSDDWRTYSIYRMTEVHDYAEQRHPGEDEIASLSLCREEEYEELESEGNE